MNSDPEKLNRQTQLPKILIIGGGFTGIISASYLRDIAQITVYEYKKEIGGAWSLETKTENDYSQQDLDKNIFYQNYKALPSSIYENLQANSACHTMALKGFPFPENTQDFPHQTQVLKYLQDYAKFRNLNQYVETNKFVQKIRISKNVNKEELQEMVQNLNQEQQENFSNELKKPMKKFIVQSCQADNQSNSKVEFFDYVICSNGHQYVPNYPKEVKGFNNWEGSMSHSHTFRHKYMLSYNNKVVLIYGFMLTAQDILMIFTKQTQQNYNRPKKIIWVGNKKQMESINKNSQSYREELDSGFLQLYGGRITEFKGKNTVILNENTEINDIDHVLLCTGYQSHYPFLDEKDGIIEFYNKEGKHNAFGPLYKHMFSINEPNFIFPGLLDGVITISYVERQMIFVKQCIEGKIKLPNKQQMLQEFENHKQAALKARPDGTAILRFLPQKRQESKYYDNLFEIQKDIKEYDTYHNEIVFGKFLPLFFGLLIKGDYPELKKNQFSKGLPPTHKYSPDINKY